MKKLPKFEMSDMPVLGKALAAIQEQHDHRLNRDLGIVLGLCGHWWQARTVPEVMEKDCPTCGRPPGAFIDCWDETWPEPDEDPE